jgi:hypothetical protein
MSPIEMDENLMKLLRVSSKIALGLNYSKILLPQILTPLIEILKVPPKKLLLLFLF